MDKHKIKPVITKIPTEYGDLWFFGFNIEGQDVIAVSNKRKITDNVRLRLHSCCLTSEVFFSLKCDCSLQLKSFLQLMSQDKKNNYLLIYFLNHEGRGIGLINKLKAYEAQRKLNLDTYEANKYYGFPYDARDYNLAIPILNYFKILHINLFSNNPKKIKFLKNNGFNVKISKLFVPPPSKYALNYLISKVYKGNHCIKDEVAKLLDG